MKNSKQTLWIIIIALVAVIVIGWWYVMSPKGLPGGATNGPAQSMESNAGL